MPERLARRSLLRVAAAGAAADRPHAQPEQVQAAEHSEHVKRAAANFPRTDNRDQRRAAPDHIAQQVTTEKPRARAPASGSANPENREHTRPRRDAVDKTRGEHSEQQ
ncbi:hypothetical protein D3C72_2143280 [compost metagenome]